MSITFDVPEIPLGRPMVPFGVFRFDPERGEMAPLARVKVVEINYREGPTPSNALFEYVSDDTTDESARIGFENAMPLSRPPDDRIVAPDDEIVVVADLGDGYPWYLFHGFAQMPDCEFDHNGQTVRFSAQGVEIRCWDSVIEGCLMRGSDDPTNAENNILTHNETRFNPKVHGITVGNQVSDGNEAETESGRKYAVFCDRLNADRPMDPDTPAGAKLGQKWNLFTSVNHLLSFMNEKEKHVKNPDYDELKSLLVVKTPRGDAQFFDPADESTYDEKQIDVPDSDVGGLPWPEAVARLLGPAGFRMNFVLEDDDEGMPKTRVEIYRENDTGAERCKSLYLQPWRAALDPAASNVSSCKMQLDTSGIVNQVSVHTSNLRIEAGFILAPMFKILAADFTTPNDFAAKSEGFSTRRDKYRLWGFDEAGEGHNTFNLTLSQTDENDVLFGDATWSTEPGDLAPIFRPDSDGKPTFAVRRRPPLPTLWTKGSDGEYLRAQLYISMDYQGDAPELQDAAAQYHWYKVSGNWEMCRDRLGIRLTHEKINEWHIGKMPAGAPTRIAGGMVRVLDWLTNPSLTQSYAFTLMLVCVVESDRRLDVLSGRRAASPTQFPITRAIDLRSKFRPGYVHISSPFYDDAVDTENDPKTRAGQEEEGIAPDDMKVQGNEYWEARDYADNKRESLQLGRWAGRVTIPRLVPGYDIGDRLAGVEGRDAPLQINIDGNGREAPAYPRIVGLTFDFHSGQSIHLILDDERSDHGARRRRK